MPNQYDFEPKSVAVVLGTRPEIIKLAHIIRMLGNAAWIIHTGQHYDSNLSQSFFAELGLPEPDDFLEVGGTSRGNQIGEAIRRLDGMFGAHRPRAVVVQGDTNAVLAGAITANAREIFLCHVEAGLRSFDRAMPEEHNRVMADHLSDLCCAPTDVNVANLAAEGISGDRVVQTGNTIVEAVTELLPEPKAREAICQRYGVRTNEFVLSTFHRPENVDDPVKYKMILEQLGSLQLPVVLPLHPRSVRRAEEQGLGALLAGLRVVEPIGYRDFLGLQAEAALVVSDSGGVQEECSILKRPLLVVRNSTERPEVMGSFARLVGAGPEIGDAAEAILSEIDSVHERLAPLPSPYGDGSATQMTVAAIHSAL